ncbi:MAG: hypothetical protein R3F48_07455 [Candidatus Zixiibacteriota bacterium]
MRRVGVFTYLSIIIILCFVCAPIFGESFGDDVPFAAGFINARNAQPLNLVYYPCTDIQSTMAVQTSYTSLYELSELTENRIGFAVKSRSFIVAAGFSSFGQSDYCLQSCGDMAISVKLYKLRAGIGASYQRISFSETYPPVSLISTNAGVSYATEQFTLYAVSRNINQPSYTMHSPKLHPEIEGGLAYHSGNGLISQVQAMCMRHRKPSAAIGQMYPIEKILDINWLLVLSPVRFGGGFRITKGNVIFGYRYSHHPVLGGIHTVSFSIFR